MSKRRFHLVGIGPLFEDLIIDIQAKYTHGIIYERGVMKHLCLVAGLKEVARDFSRSTGGSSANIVCMLSRLGEYSMGYFSKLGSDAISEWLITDLQDFGINTDGIIREEGEAGASIIVTDPTIRDRSIISYRGIGDRVSPGDIQRKKEYLLNKLQTLKAEDVTRIREAFIQNNAPRFMKYFFPHRPYGKKKLFAEKLMKASLERLAHLVKVCGLLLQTKVYLFWKSRLERQ